MSQAPPISCARCGAPASAGGCRLHPAAGTLDLRQDDDRELALDLRALTRSRRERLATLVAALAAATGGVGLLVQGTVPWGGGGAPTGWLAGVAVAVAAVLVTVALGIRRDAASGPLAAPSTEVVHVAAGLRRVRWLRLAGHAAALLSAPYALVGVVALIAEPAGASLAAVANVLPFLLGLTLLEAARRVEVGVASSEAPAADDAWLGVAPGPVDVEARPARSNDRQARMPRRVTG